MSEATHLAFLGHEFGVPLITSLQVIYRLSVDVRLAQNHLTQKCGTSIHAISYLPIHTQTQEADPDATLGLLTQQPSSADISSRCSSQLMFRHSATAVYSLLLCHHFAVTAKNLTQQLY